MIVLDNSDALRGKVSTWKEGGQTIGFVPTMGALHAGHLSLVKQAIAQADIVIVSIFVNPTQFAPNEDFDAYPRGLEDDLKKLEPLGVQAVYAPRVEDLYPDGTAATKKAGEAARGLESDFRPHFFDGVVTVVSRLFDQVEPDLAIFGEKDFQQLKVIREMVAHDQRPIRIYGGETKRDALGLALSSRNAYLSADELEIARMLNQILYGLAHGIDEGIDIDDACDNAKEMLLEAGFDRVDYVTYKSEWKRVLIAAWLGKTRLIDNAPVGSVLLLS